MDSMTLFDSDSVVINFEDGPIRYSLSKYCRGVSNGDFIHVTETNGSTHYFKVFGYQPSSINVPSFVVQESLEDGLREYDQIVGTLGNREFVAKSTYPHYGFLEKGNLVEIVVDEDESDLCEVVSTNPLVLKRVHVSFYFNDNDLV